MTSIQTSAELAGRKAAEQLETLLSRSSGGNHDDEVLLDVLPSKLCVRESTAPPAH